MGKSLFAELDNIRVNLICLTLERYINLSEKQNQTLQNTHAKAPELLN
jgi:hypothetical protein